MCENFYLDLRKISILSKKESDIIHNYYRDMLYAFQDGRNSMGNSILYTLLKNGYLIDIREEKINNIING
jgi:hypothetical protein